MREFSRRVEQLSQLVDAHFLNDPYYPRARSENRLFQVFKAAYLREAGKVGFVYVERAVQFIELLEVTQAERDVAAATSSLET